MDQHQGFTGRELYEIWRSGATARRVTNPPEWDALDATTRETWEEFAAVIMPSD
ncbi:hypothetical protein [Cupriavidus alkaliphilus]|uniref:hypothetical protein n=1 Tax=Cupriavidus alkaliphilus TaxID=942866 RepID=UPI0016099E92|nr:hypothetical protein [Cupriavidus alkaliphilus]MBB2915903.1 hypothetical protein [Cupriavidus alkaliphilus]